MDEEGIARLFAIQAEYERAEREDDEFREENIPSLTAWRDAKVPEPEEGEPWMTIEWDALDEYVREAKEADRG